MGLLEKVAGTYTSRPTAFVKSGGAYGAPGGLQTLGSMQFSTIVGFGDSQLEALSFTTAERWINIVGNALGATSVFNRGLSGTVLQNSNVAAGSPSPNNGLDRYNTTNYGVVGANRRKFIFIALGFNDARYTGAPGTFNVTLFLADYHELIAKLIDAGYTPDTICIVAPYYITDTGLQSGSAGFTGQTREVFEQHVAATYAVAQAHNTWWYDAYSYLRDNGGASLMGPDFYHLNTLGQAVTAQGALLATRANARSQPVLSVSSPAPGTVNWSFPSVAGATSYTVEYMLAGGIAFTGTTTGASLSGQFTGLTPGYVNVRARANFADGSSGWKPARVLAADAVAFRMTFTGAAGTAVTDLVPEVGGALVGQTGYAPATPSVTDGNGAAYSTTTAGVYRSNMTPLGPNYRIDAVIKYLSAVSGDNCGITFNASDSANTFYFVSPFRTDNTLRAYRNASGSNTPQPNPPSRPFNSGSLSLQIFVRDTLDGPKQIEVYEVGNPTALITFTDPTPITGGSWGIRDACVKAVGTGWHIDDMTVTYIDPLAS